MLLAAGLSGRGDFFPLDQHIGWMPHLLWTMVLSDALIAAAFFAISIAVWIFLRKRSPSSIGRVAALFSVFVFACGLAHVMNIWGVWHPDYSIQAMTKALVAALSVSAATTLWLIVPSIAPSVRKLQSTIDSLKSDLERLQPLEASLFEAQQHLAYALSSVDAGFLSTDRAGNVTHLNAIAQRVLGWKETEAIGLRLSTVFARTDRPAAYFSQNPVDVMLQEGVTADVAHQIVAISRTGRRTELELRSSLIHAQDGTVRGMAIVFRDLTKVTRLEAETDRLAAIVSSSRDAIIGKRLDGTITSWNGAAQAMFGYTPGEAIGQPIQMLIPPDRQHEEMQILYQLSLDSHIAPFETVRRTKDGRDIDVSIAISPIHDANGTIIGASKIARDVTEIHRTEAALRELADQNNNLLETNRAKSQFLANMSHELRTPLNAIIGFADLLQGDLVPQDSSKRAEFLAHISTSGRHLLRLINDVLDLSKVESGKFTLFPKKVVLRTLIDEVFEIVQKGLLKKQLTMDVMVEADLTDIELDPTRLKQVLFNLLSNAVKFTPEGGRVTVRAAAVGPDHFRLEVEDTGIGIAAADLSKLFVEFQQLDTTYSKTHEGTGLGLALTRRLVWAQGGTVGVSSTPGVGSVFHVVLNRVHGTDAARDPSVESHAAHRMLVIEGDKTTRVQLLRELSDAGFRVDGAASGEQALSHSGRTPYDAIVLDLMLPDQSGLGVLAHIRSKGPNQASPVVGVSVPAHTGGSAGFAVSNVLSKPIRIDEIVSAMSRFRLPVNNRANVLVIDDDPQALDLMRAMLKSIGIDCVCLQDGRDAILELDSHKPDAIILDLMMPEFDGFAVLDALRSMPRWQATPVYIWTAMVLGDDEYARLSQTASAILSKGGGDVSAILNSLRQWRPPTVLPSGPQARNVT